MSPAAAHPDPAPQAGPCGTGRTLVLGGGGVTGIAWEVGVLAGLAEGGADFGAGLVLGTSAGSFVGAAVASGADLEELFAAQHREAAEESRVQLPAPVYERWVRAYRSGAGDPLAIGRGFGQVAASVEPVVSRDQRHRTVRHRLATEEFPPRLRVAVQDAESGVVHAFGPSDGCPLAEVVSASGAVPGISPSVPLLGRIWVDGGMVSSANIGLAEGAAEVLAVVPLPVNHGGVPSAAQELEALASPRRRHLVVPDAASREAIGENIYDASRRAQAADAGRAQGLQEAAALRQG